MNCAEPASGNKQLHFIAVAVDGAISSAVYGPQEMLFSTTAIQASLGLPDPVTIRFEVLSPEGDSFTDSCGRQMPTDGGLKEVPGDAVIFFPGFGIIMHDELESRLDRYRHLGDWLRAQHEKGCTLATGCNGNFLLMEAGLLQDRPVTTSWLYAEMFKTRYPAAALDLNSILLDYNRVISVGGILCGLDLMLLVIEKYVGTEVARLCTKFMLLDNRQPSKVPFEQRQTVFNQDRMIQQAVNWIRENLHQRITLEDIVAQVPASKRNLRGAFGRPPGKARGNSSSVPASSGRNPCWRRATCRLIRSWKKSAPRTTALSPASSATTP
jgi:transcriptional regulator GlxA family with amidase domain